MLLIFHLIQQLLQMSAPNYELSAGYASTVYLNHVTQFWKDTRWTFRSNEVCVWPRQMSLLLGLLKKNVDLRRRKWREA